MRIQEFVIADAAAGPNGITIGPDRAAWVTFTHSGGIARVSDDGDVEVFDLGAPAAQPTAITTGPDGALWFTRTKDDRIGRLTLDGHLSDVGAGQIGRITPAGDIDEFPLADRAARPHAVAAGPGDVWFTEWGSGRVGHVTGDGRVTGWDLPTPRSEPHGLAVGADGVVWVALEIGRLVRMQP